jgi:hypothetical protein
VWCRALRRSNLCGLFSASTSISRRSVHYERV